MQPPARMTDTRRRVKVYTLNEERQWDDRGTGHVSSGYVERLKGTSLLVRAESDGKIMSLIRSCTYINFIITYNVLTTVKIAVRFL